MQQQHFAEVIDVLIGRPTSPVTHYGETHTEDSWEQTLGLTSVERVHKTCQWF